MELNIICVLSHTLGMRGMVPGGPDGNGAFGQLAMDHAMCYNEPSVIYIFLLSKHFRATIVCNE